MGLFNRFRRGSGHRPTRLVGHIAEAPQVVGQNGTKYMVFHLVEAPGTEFRLKMLPTTPRRRKGDRVEVTCVQSGDGLVIVETLYSAPDPEALRRRNAEYLHNIEAQDAKEKH